MRHYTVHHRSGVREEIDPDVVFIKEGFCWPVLFLPLLWMLYRLQFWGLLAYLAVTILLSGLIAFTGMDHVTGFALSLVIALFVAAIANDWRRWRLGARGYELIAVVAANNLRGAEDKFFREDWRGEEPGPDESGKPTAPLPASGLTPFATPFDPV